MVKNREENLRKTMEFDTAIVEFMSHPSEYVASSAIQAGQVYCKINPMLVTSAVSSKIKDANSGAAIINLKSVSAKLAWAHLCGYTGKKEPWVLYELQTLLASKEIQVAVVALESLLKFDWEVFTQMMFEPGSWPPHQGSVSVLELSTEKLTELMTSNVLPFQHAGVRLTESLAEKFMKHAHHEGMSSPSGPSIAPSLSPPHQAPRCLMVFSRVL